MSSSDEDDDLGPIIQQQAAYSFGNNPKGGGFGNGGGFAGGAVLAGLAAAAAATSTPTSRFASVPSSGGGIGFNRPAAAPQPQRLAPQPSSSLFPPRSNAITPSGAGRSVSWSKDTQGQMNKRRDCTNSFSLNKYISLNSWPFFGQGQSFLGKTVWEWISGRHKASFSDSIDRLNCATVPKLLLFFVALITANIFGIGGSDPIVCLKTPELNNEERDYALDYCSTKNTYYVAPEESIPWSDAERNKRQLGYYHWVPITLLLQAMLFCLPNWLWNTMNQQSGIDYEIIVREATELRSLAVIDPEREKRLADLAGIINEAVGEGRISKRLHGFRFGGTLGIYIAGLYVFIKLLYLLNVVAQFGLLNAFIGQRYTLWGVEVLQALLTGENWQDSPIFPRLTLCDVPIRRLGDTPRYTLQCHLRINTYNEKIYLFIWWGLLVTALLTVVNFFYYLIYLLLMPWTKERAARHLLKQEEFQRIIYSDSRRNIHLVHSFADHVLRHDGVLLFWFIEGHAGPIIARSICGRMFADYLRRMDEKETEEYPDRRDSSYSQQTTDQVADDDGDDGTGGPIKKTPSAFTFDDSGNFTPSSRKYKQHTPTAPSAGEESPLFQQPHDDHPYANNVRPARDDYTYPPRRKSSVLSRVFNKIFNGDDGNDEQYRRGSRQHYDYNRAKIV